MANQPGQGMFSESRGGLKVSSLTFVKSSKQTKRALPHHQGKSRFYLTRGPPGTQWFHKMHSYSILRRVVGASLHIVARALRAIVKNFRSMTLTIHYPVVGDSEYSRRVAI